MQQPAIDSGRHLAFAFTDKFGGEFLLHGADRVAALELDRKLERLGQVGRGGRLDPGAQGSVDVARHGARLLRRLFRQANDRLDGMLHFLMAEHHGAQHHVFAEFLGFGFHHHHRVMGAGDDQFQLGLGHFIQRRIETVFAVDVTNAGSPDRAHEGQARNRQGRRHGDHRHHIGIIFQIVGQDLRHDQRFIAIAVGKQRADGAVDQA